MEQYYKRHFEFQLGKKAPVKLYKDIIWVKDRSVFRPLGPAFYDYSVSKEDIAAITIGWNYSLLTYTDGFAGSKKDTWYAVICRKFISLDEERNSKLRYEINRGLKNSRIELIDAEYVASKGYDILRSASAKYSKSFSTSEQDFKKEILSAKTFSDIIQYWGIFCDNKLIGYSEVYVYGTKEADYSSIKIDPVYQVNYPSYALLYKMNEHYLNNLKFDYANDGFRTILHTTGIQDFLIKKFNFFMEYTNIHVHFNPLLRFALKAGTPFRIITENLDPNIKALYTLYDLSK